MKENYTYAASRSGLMIQGLLAFGTIYVGDKHELLKLRNTIASFISEDEEPELNKLMVAAIAVVDAELTRDNEVQQ